MEFGERLTMIRKDKKMSQSELAKKVGIHSNVLGRYERGEARPFVEMAAKLAEALDVSLDYLYGNTQLELDADMLKRIQEVSKLPSDSKNYILGLIDMALRDFKTRQAYS